MPAGLCAALALAETAPIAWYARALVARDPACAAWSLVCSAVGAAAGYLALLALASRRRWLGGLLLPAIAGLSASSQLVHFGVQRELGALPSVSTVDFVRQNTRYACALFLDRLDAPKVALAAALLAGAVAALHRASRRMRQASPGVLLGLTALALAPYELARRPFLSTSQRAAQLVVASLSGTGTVNTAWLPDRVRPASAPARHPINIILFRLEEIAARATTLARPTLPTTPFLKSLADEHPDETFVGLLHFSNATATDVSVLGIFSGLGPAAPLDEQRRVPLLWDYFRAAGYDTSLFLPDHLEWGDFRHRFEARPGELNLNRVVDAGNAQAPLVYDHSINDASVIAAALEYQQRRGWAEPFLQVVSLRMPHALGEGARINQLGRGPWPGEPRELWDYYDGIRHDDALMADFVAQVPEAVRRRSALVFVSDHGTRSFARHEGGSELHRLDNYHTEATRVPFVLHLPAPAQQGLDGGWLRRLRDNLSVRATSNIDLVPTLLGLVGIERVEDALPQASGLVGRDLGAALESDATIIQCNTGPLRRWDREHFALVLNDGAYHYFAGAFGEHLFDSKHDPLERIDVVGEAAFRAPLERARALARGVPELWRIYQAYATATARDAAPSAHASAPASPPATGLHTTRPPPERIVLPPGAPDQEITAYAIEPSRARAVEGRFAVRVAGGRGHLDWRVRGAGELYHVAQADGLEPGDVLRFELRWRSPAGSEVPLSVQLWGGAGGDETLELRMARAEAARENDERRQGVEDAASLEVLAFDTNREEDVDRHANADRHTNVNRGASAEKVAAAAGAPLGSFTQHACLTGARSEPCPNGFLSWGPYVPAQRGARASLRYDIAGGSSPLRVWIDIAAGRGNRLIARSRGEELTEAGARTWLLHARLDADASDLEGRLNVHGGARVEPGALVVHGAALRVDPAPLVASGSSP